MLWKTVILGTRRRQYGLELDLFRRATSAHRRLILAYMDLFRYDIRLQLRKRCHSVPVKHETIKYTAMSRIVNKWRGTLHHTTSPERRKITLFAFNRLSIMTPIDELCKRPALSTIVLKNCLRFQRAVHLSNVPRKNVFDNISLLYHMRPVDVLS